MRQSIQITLTVPEGKRLIAKALSLVPEIQEALVHGLILLKGGTTVSALCEELCGVPLRISGRISATGTRAARDESRAPHVVLLDHGRPQPLMDLEAMASTVRSMGPGDVSVMGANIIDAQGNAAMMAGAELGGAPGQVISGLMAQGAHLFIAAGLEKMSPVSVGKAVLAAGRTRMKRSMGMAVGLIPIYGRLVTEMEALTILGRSLGEEPAVSVIGRGGMDGAEGSTTFVVSGETDTLVEGVWEEVWRIKGSGHSGEEASLPECAGAGPSCARHRSCCYVRRLGP
ncbi:MAG: hypothetical protein AB1576_02475 [Bacillota bacterium]